VYRADQFEAAEPSTGPGSPERIALQLHVGILVLVRKINFKRAFVFQSLASFQTVHEGMPDIDHNHVGFKVWRSFPLRRAHTYTVAHYLAVRPSKSCECFDKNLMVIGQMTRGSVLKYLLGDLMREERVAPNTVSIDIPLSCAHCFLYYVGSVAWTPHIRDERNTREVKP